MNPIGTYLLQMCCWLAAFWLVYSLVLRKETYFQLNRWFLISGLLVSAVGPFIPVSYKVYTAIQTSTVSLPTIVASPTTAPISEAASGSRPNYWLIAYSSGILIFIVRLLFQQIKLFRLRKSNHPIHLDGLKIYRIQKESAPFSFFNHIYVHSTMSTGPEMDTVIAHEKVHITERHWADLLLLELVRTIQWFNPLLILYRKAITQNHEYLADTGTLQRGVNARTYQTVLASQMLGVPLVSFANSFTFRNTTNRITMMNKDKSTPMKRLKLFLILPLMAAIVMGFAKPKYVMMESNESSLHATESKTIKGVILDPDGDPLPGVTIANIDNDGRIITGTATSSDGKFILKGVDSGDDLSISFVGFKNVRTKAEEDMVVTMEKLSTELPDVVVKGKRIIPAPPLDLRNVLGGENGERPLLLLNGKLFKGDINSIEADQIEHVEVLKGADALAAYGDNGKNGVVRITTKQEPVSSKSNSDKITMWGVDSVKIANNSQPLFVIDGVVSTDKIVFNNLPPGDIEKIEVLKNEAAIAAYGNKARNGVIIVTTKDRDHKASFNEGQVFVPGEEYPQYPGGLNAFFDYLNEGTANSMELESSEIYFVVEKNGSIDDVKVVEGASDELNKLAADLITKMPNWTPGMQGGKAIVSEVQVRIDLNSNCNSIMYRKKNEE